MLVSEVTEAGITYEQNVGSDDRFLHRRFEARRQLRCKSGEYRQKEDRSMVLRGSSFGDGET